MADILIPSSKEIDPSIRLPDKRLEATARLSAEGLAISKAWQQTAPTDITIGAGHQKAVQLRKHEPFLARVQYLRENQDKPEGLAQQERIDQRPQNALATTEDVLAHFRHVATAGNDKDALAACKELLKHIQAKESSRPDPAYLFSYLITAELDGKEPCVDAAGSMDALAEVVSRACGNLYKVTLEEYGEIGTFQRSGYEKKARDNEGSDRLGE